MGGAVTQLTKNFTREELACHHCGQMHMPQADIDRLQRLRDRVGHFLKVSSGYRCPTHNNAVSKTGHDGPHTKGAVDVLIHGPEAFHLLVAALAEGYTGIGVNQIGKLEGRFIHLDAIDDSVKSPRPALWSY